ncbi:MAG TPA: heme-binding protein [Phycisphaerales bacterium]|nr:heme-binding protein [Phycisphaerales bacterium]HRQ74946.1 heme-binding protein [Phycisphaerales bacterium]
MIRQLIIALTACIASTGCMRAPQWAINPSLDDAADARPVSHHLGTPDADWQVLRVGGDMDARITGSNGDWRFNRSRVDTPLPDGYPPPTPPGSIELKKYPGVRRAEVSGSVNPNLGMNFAFFPLFQHIKRRNIDMTSPVEMDYPGWQGQNNLPSEWTMSFLYRSSDLGPTGDDGRVRIIDTEPLTVLAIGMNGSYMLSTVMQGIEALNAWLAEQDEWTENGSPRAFYYNDPGVPNRMKWLEVQIPVRLK